MSALTALAGFGVSAERLTTAEPFSTAKRTLVGSNVYGWTQYAQRDKKQFDVEEVISALRDTGYDYLESFMNVAQPDANVHFAEQLRAKGLQPVSLYVGARLHEAGKCDEVVERILVAAKACQACGFQVISCNADPIGREKTEEELKTQAEALQKLRGRSQCLGNETGSAPTLARDGQSRSGISL